jgi:hypothetical protein
VTGGHGGFLVHVVVYVTVRQRRQAALRLPLFCTGPECRPAWGLYQPVRATAGSFDRSVRQ